MTERRETRLTLNDLGKILDHVGDEIGSPVEVVIDLGKYTLRVKRLPGQGDRSTRRETPLNPYEFDAEITGKTPDADVSSLLDVAWRTRRPARKRRQVRRGGP